MLINFSDRIFNSPMWVSWFNGNFIWWKWLLNLFDCFYGEYFQVHVRVNLLGLLLEQVLGEGVAVSFLRTQALGHFVALLTYLLAPDFRVVERRVVWLENLIWQNWLNAGVWVEEDPYRRWRGQSDDQLTQTGCHYVARYIYPLKLSHYVRRPKGIQLGCGQG